MAKGIKVVVEAVDRVTRPFRQMFGALRNVNLAPLRDQLGRVVSAAKTAGAEIGRMARNAGIAIAGMAAAAGAILARVARSSNEAAAGAERLGISMRAYQGLGYAAQRSGAEIAEMGDAIKDLNTKVIAAATGNKELQSGFRRMGVELRDANGNLRATEDIFVDIADAFARVPDGAKKSAAAMALMGENGLKMIPLLNRGGDSLRDMMEEAERLGLVFDEKTAKGFKALSEDMLRLRAVATGLQNTIAARLLPIFAPLVQSFTEWTIANREIIATRIAEWIDALPGILTQAEQAARAWLAALSPIGTAVAWVVEQLGPFHSGILLVSGVIGGKLLMTLWPLLRALTGLGLVIAKLTVAPLVAMLVQLFTAVRAGTGVMAAFNLVLAANPIGAVVAAVAALAAAAYLIYQHWDAVAPYFAALWDAVKQAFNGIVEFVAGIFTGDLGRAFDGIEAVAAGLAGVVSALWSPVVDAFRAFLGWIDGTFGTGLLAAFDGLAAGIRDVLGSIGAYLSGLWTDARAVFEGFAGFVAGVFLGDLGRAFAGVEAAAAGLAGYFGKLWSPVMDAYRAFLGWIDGTFGTGLLAAFDGLVAGVRDVLEGFAGFVAGVFTGDLGRAFAGMEAVAGGLAGYFGKLWSPVMDAYRAFLGWIDGTFGTGLLAAFDGLVEGVGAMIAALAGDGLWEPVIAAFGAVADWISGTFAPMMRDGVQLVYDTIKPIIDMIAAAIAGISAGIDRVVGAASWAKDKVSAGLGAVGSGISSARNYIMGDGGEMEQRAGGGPVRKGQPYIVGEKGWEVFVPSTAGRIVPHHEAAAMARGAPAAPDVPSAFSGGAPAAKVDAGGTLDVRVHYDKPPTVSAKMNDPRIGTDVSAGPSLVAP